MTTTIKIKSIPPKMIAPTSAVVALRRSAPVRKAQPEASASWIGTYHTIFRTTVSPTIAIAPMMSRTMATRLTIRSVCAETCHGSIV